MYSPMMPGAAGRQRENFRRIGDGLERQDEDRDAKQNGGEAHRDHADQHPGDDFHAAIPVARMNHTRRGAVTASPKRSMPARGGPVSA